MSKLEELEEELYGKEDEEDLARRMKKRMIIPGRLRRLPTGWLSKPKKAEVTEEMAKSKMGLFTKILLGIFGLLVLGLSGFFVFYYLGTRGEEAKIEIHGENLIESGDLITIPVELKNVSKAMLRDIEVLITLPGGSTIFEEGFENPAPLRISKKLEDIIPGDNEIVEIHTRMFGREGEELIVQIEMLYRPESLQAQFSSKAAKSFTVVKVPLSVSWNIPDIVSHGQRVEAKVYYASSAKVPFENMALRVTYPSGFVFRSANIDPDADNNIWLLGTLSPDESGTITLEGDISGEEGETKVFIGELGIFNEVTREWTSYIDSIKTAEIAYAPLSVQGGLESKRDIIIVPGRTLGFKVSYQNNTDYILRNITVRAFVEEVVSDLISYERLLEFPSLTIGQGGVFEAATHGILWAPGGTDDLRELAPGDRGEFTFRINTKERPVVRSPADKNFKIRLRSTIDALTIPRELQGTDIFFEDKIEFPVESAVLFWGRSAYYSSPISNSGPMPPKVGARTTYTIFWEIRNFINDLKDVEVKTKLPPNVKWEGVITPSDANIAYDEASGDITWFIGDVSATTGVLTPAVTLAFQVSLIPTEPDINKSPKLIDVSYLKGHDTFTDQPIEKELKELTTSLKDDPLSSSKEWRVEE